ncbi:MAG: hypothetical protein JWM55_861 [Acidimicrobiaceae bacterium]|nr:hypothetical protein [Acidimicrobiaceae bacterium]
MARRAGSRRILIAALALFGASTLGSIALAATTPKPPFITEHFTRLPCNKNTTIGLEGCAEDHLLKADARLNQQVATVFELFRTHAQKLEFVTAETSWFAFRKDDCRSLAAIYEGGSIAPLAYAECEVRDDVARSADLHSFYVELTQGDNVNVPPWP